MIASKTKLYKAVKKKLGKNQDWPRTRAELVSVITTQKGIDTSTESLSESFLWSNSPQGFMYWALLYGRMCK